MIKLDDKDHRIISALKHNSRYSIREIAKKTQIRPSTVHQRVNKLIKNRVIEQFTLKLNSKAIGENFIVFIFLTAKENLPDSFFQSSCIKEAFGITGEYDLILKMKFKDIEDFNQYIINMRKNKSITKTLTYVATLNLKEEI